MRQKSQVIKLIVLNVMVSLLNKMKKRIAFSLVLCSTSYPAITVTVSRYKY